MARRLEEPAMGDAQGVEASISVLMLCANDVSHDTRVLKTARSLAQAGYHVNLVGIGRPGTEEVRDAAEWGTLTVVAYGSIETRKSGRTLMARASAVELAGTHDAYLAGLETRSSLLSKLLLIIAQRWRMRKLIRPIRRNSRSQRKPPKRRGLDRLLAFASRKSSLGLAASWLRQRTFTASLATAVAKSGTGQPSIVHAHDLLTLRVGVRIREATGARLIYDAHELEMHRNKPYSLGRNIVDQISEWSGIRHADGVITVSDGIADALAKSYGIERPTVVLNSPSEKALPSGTDPDTPNLRQLSGLPTEATLIAYSGIVAPARRVGLLVKALNQLPTDHHLAILGPRRDDRDLPLMQLAERRGVAARVHMFESVPPEQVPQALVGVDLFVIPAARVTRSYDLSLPNKLYDAVFAGVPVLVANLSSMKEFVEQYKVGISRGFEDHKHLARAIQEALGLRSTFDLSETNRRRIASEFGWESQEKRLLELYRHLLPLDKDPGGSG